MLCGADGQKTMARRTKQSRKDVAVWHPFANGERTVI